RFSEFWTFLGNIAGACCGLQRLVYFCGRRSDNGIFRRSVRRHCLTLGRRRVSITLAVPLLDLREVSNLFGAGIVKILGRVFAIPETRLLGLSTSVSRNDSVLKSRESCQEFTRVEGL